MLKKIGSFFINAFMLIFVIVLSCLMIARLFLSGSSMTDLVDVIIEEEGGFIEEITDSDVNSDFGNYINEEEIEKEIGQFVSDYLKYTGGAPGAERPNADGLKRLFEKYIEEYEKDNNVEFDDTELQEIFNELDEEMDELVNEPVDEDVALVFRIIYSDTLLIGIALVIVGCILINYLLRRDWFIIMRHCGIVITINFIMVMLVGGLLNLASDPTMDAADMALMDVIKNTFNRIGIIGLAIGIVLIVLSILLKKKNNNSNLNPVQNDFMNN